VARFDDEEGGGNYQKSDSEDGAAQVQIAGIICREERTHEGEEPATEGEHEPLVTGNYSLEAIDLVMRLLQVGHGFFTRESPSGKVNRPLYF
jgi:hypothetical protein